MNADGAKSHEPVENVRCRWAVPPVGRYKVYVHGCSVDSEGLSSVSFQVRVAIFGRVTMHEGQVSSEEKVLVTEFVVEAEQKTAALPISTAPAVITMETITALPI